MQKTLLSILMLIASVFLKNQSYAQTDYAFFSTINSVYTGTWTCPQGVTTVTIYARGAGGAGGSAQGNGVAGGGGAGGAFSQKVVTVVPGTVYTYNLGMGGKPTDPTQTAYGGNGGNTWFGNPATIQAQGGNGGQNGVGTSSGPSAGAGGIGSSANSVGDIVYAGGSGAAGNPAASYGGGGGGSAGQGSNGRNAVNEDGAEGGDINGSYGENGGNISSGVGRSNSSIGGAGGGAYSRSFLTILGGSGGDGNMFMTWEVVLAINIESFTGNKSNKGNNLHLILNTTNEKNIEVHLEKNKGDNVWSDIAQQKVDNESGRHIIDFVDDKAISGMNQYRVKVITDGETRYSNIIALGNNNATASIKMLPNPSADASVLNIQSFTDEKAIISITDISGKTIISHMTSLQTGNNNIDMNLSNLAAGNYQVSVESQHGGITTLRFVKQ